MKLDRDKYVEIEAYTLRNEAIYLRSNSHRGTVYRGERTKQDPTPQYSTFPEYISTISMAEELLRALKDYSQHLDSGLVEVLERVRDIEDLANLPYTKEKVAHRNSEIERKSIKVNETLTNPITNKTLTGTYFDNVYNNLAKYFDENGDKTLLFELLKTYLMEYSIVNHSLKTETPQKSYVDTCIEIDTLPLPHMGYSELIEKALSSEISISYSTFLFEETSLIVSLHSNEPNVQSIEEVQAYVTFV